MEWTTSIPVRDNIQLRLLVPDDAARVFEILEKDPNIRERFVTWTAGLTSEEAVREAIENFQENDVVFRFAIVDGDRLIGYVGTWSNTPDGKEYDGGYFIDRDERGKGIALAAMKALIEAASKNLPVELSLCTYGTRMNRAKQLRESWVLSQQRELNPNQHLAEYQNAVGNYR